MCNITGEGGAAVCLCVCVTDGEGTLRQEMFFREREKGCHSEHPCIEGIYMETLRIFW